MPGRIRKHSLILQLTLVSLLSSAFTLPAQPVIESELNLGGPVLSWRPDPLADGYSIQYADAPELEFEPVVIMADNSFYPDLRSGFFRITPLYNQFISFTDTLRLQVKATCDDWRGPLGNEVVDLHEYALDLVDASFADTLRFYPDDDGWTQIPIRDDRHLRGNDDFEAAFFGTATEPNRFSFRLITDRETIGELFTLPQDLRISARTSIWYVFQSLKQDLEFIASSGQLDAGQREGFLRLPSSWYAVTPAAVVDDVAGEDYAAVDNSFDDEEWPVAKDDAAENLPLEFPTSSTWLTRDNEGLVISQQRVQWTATLLQAMQPIAEVVRCFDNNTQQINNWCHDRIDRIRGPPHSS